MASVVQKQFRIFHATIKLNWNDEHALLRDKRDIVLNKLRARLKERFTAENKPVPTFQEANQGSYAMGTGIKPLNGDFDLDVALRFNLSIADQPDPVTVKEWVLEALDDHTNNVMMRRPCVTVWYTVAGELAYHLDLAVYSDGRSNSDGKTYLAKGFSGSAAENRIWEESDPLALVGLMCKRFEGEDQAQFRRVICCLKRWKDENFRSDGEAAPRGIGLTSAAYRWFSPNFTVTDWMTGAREYNDLEATRSLVHNMQMQFVPTVHEGEYAYRLCCPLPVPPGNDPFNRMSNKQMSAFRGKLQTLKQALDDASRETDPVVACTILSKVFGSDFPIPSKEETAKSVGPAVISSNVSA